MKHRFGFLMNTELNELYVTMAMRSFAISMINLFVPIYLIQQGYTVFWVFIYFAVLALSHTALTPIAAKYASKHGFKHTIFFSIPFLIIYYLMLYTLDMWPLLLIPVIHGISNSHFWMGYHVDFSKYSAKKSRGSQLGTAKIISSLFTVAGPVIGGFILVIAGFKVLFAIVALLLLLTFIPLFYSNDTHEPITFKLRNILKGKTFRDLIAYLAFGIEAGANFVIWPLFLFFFVISDFSGLGLIHSLSLFFSLVFTYLAGKMTNKNSGFVIKAGSIMNALVWGLSMVIRTGVQSASADALYGISQVFMRLPFNARCYEKANAKDRLNYITFREMTINFGRGVFLIVMAFAANFLLSFLYAGAASLILFIF